MSQSYFFALIPLYLKPDHSFAKTIKPNTKYRLVLYKGIQKCDEMKQPIKSKLVGGRIDLQAAEMFFSVQFYTPLKNIQFTLKLYEEKPGQEETEIGVAAVMSSDYIKKYKNDEGTSYFVEARFKDDVGVGFDLVVEKSKYALKDAMKAVGTKSINLSKQVIDENRSQSSRSKQIVRSGDGFISPHKRIQRKSGHKGKFLSRNNSRQDGDANSQGSLVSSQRRFHKSPPSKQGEHFMHFPKKASPPKVGQAGKSVPKSEKLPKINEKTVENKQEVNQNMYNYRPADNLKFQNTKEIFDIKLQRNSPGLQSPILSSKQNMVQKPSTAKSTILPPPVKNSGLQSPTPSQSTGRQATSSNIYQRKVASIQKSNIKPQYKVEPQAKPQQKVDAQTISLQKGEAKIKPQDKIESRIQKKSQQKIESSNISIKRTDSASIRNPPKDTNINNFSSDVQASSQKTTLQPKVETKIQGSIHEPQLVVVNCDDRSLKTDKSIEVKHKPVVKKEKGSVHESGRFKGSLGPKEMERQKKHDEEAKVADKAAEDRKMMVLYVIFMGVSIFLIYHAMGPTRRV